MDKDLQQDILERIVRIETKIDSYNNLREKLDNTANRSDVHEEQISSLSKKIDKMEDKQVWLSRSLLGSIIVIVLNIFFELIKRM